MLDRRSQVAESPPVVVLLRMTARPFGGRNTSYYILRLVVGPPKGSGKGPKGKTQSILDFVSCGRAAVVAAITYMQTKTNIVKTDGVSKIGFRVNLCDAGCKYWHDLRSPSLECTPTPILEKPTVFAKLVVV